MRSLCIGLVALALGCDNAAPPPLMAAPAPVRDPAEQITVEQLKRHVTVLAADDMEGRAAGSPGEVRAARYIWSEMKRMGLVASGAYDITGAMGYWQTFRVAENGFSRNCLGFFPGSDEAVRDQVVILAAHHDGIGKVGATRGPAVGGAEGEDRVWNGADDNASGVAAVLAIAEAFMAGNVRTRRSILFMTFGNQEEAFGMPGALFYVNHCITPREKHVLVVNLDMIGRNPERPLEIEGIKTAKGDALEKSVKSAAAGQKLAIKPYDFAGEALFRGDGAQFMLQHIPTLHLWSHTHTDYHRVTDSADKLSYERMQVVARAVLKVVRDAADAPAALAWNEATPQGDDRPRLGVKLEDVTGDALTGLGLAAGRGAVRVGQLDPAGIGAKAGLQQGDVIVAFDGRALSGENSLDSLRTAVGNAAREKDYAVEIRREGKADRITVRWPKSP